MSELPLEGGCLCGDVRYRIDAQPLWTAYCHCTTCRRSTGAPVTMFVGARSDSVRFTAGKRAMYASSPDVQRGFCARCGTPLTYESERRWPGETHFYVSTFDVPQALPPAFHVFHEERLEWLDISDALPRHATTSRRDSDEQR